MNLWDDYPRLLLALLAVAVTVTVVFAAATSVTAFGGYNPTWEGTSELRDELRSSETNVTIARTVSTYEDVPPEQSVAIVLSPTATYEGDGATVVRQFVRRGGTLVVAEDFGRHSNQLLDAVGASARVDGRPLRDKIRYTNSQNFTVVPNVTDHRLTGGVDRVVLNHGTVIDPNGATVIATSSQFAYLDENRDGRFGRPEPLGTFPVMTTETVGEGSVVVLSDPSMFINAMIGQADNQPLFDAMLSNYQHVVLDYSHAGAIPPLVGILFDVRTSPGLQVILGLAGLGAVAASRRLYRRWRRDETEAPPGTLDTDPQAVASYLVSRRPEWDRERVERMVSASTRHEDSSAGDRNDHE